MLETLKADADLVGSLETGIEETLASDDELAIMKEFEEDSASPEPTTPTKSAEVSPTPRQVEPPTPAQPAPEQPPTPPSKESTRRADAEPN